MKLTTNAEYAQALETQLPHYEAAANDNANRAYANPKGSADWHDAIVEPIERLHQLKEQIRHYRSLPPNATAKLR